MAEPEEMSLESGKCRSQWRLPSFFILGGLRIAMLVYATFESFQPWEGNVNDARERFLAAADLHHLGLVAVGLFALCLGLMAPILETDVGSQGRVKGVPRVLARILFALYVGWMLCYGLNVPSEITPAAADLSQRILLFFPAMAAVDTAWMASMWFTTKQCRSDCA